MGKNGWDAPLMAEDEHVGHTPHTRRSMLSSAALRALLSESPCCLTLGIIIGYYLGMV